MRKLFEMQFEKKSTETAALDAGKLEEKVRKMHENIDIVISKKQEKDLLSDSFNQYLKAPPE